MFISPVSRIHSHALLIFAALTLAVGCTPPEELVKKMLSKHLEECRAADGDFAEVETFDGSTETVLKVACTKELTELSIEDGIKGTAKTGPYIWHVATNPDSGVWVLSGIEWRDMTDARRILDEDDPEANTLRAGLENMEAIQKALPESTWVRKNHMRMLLDLRKKTRVKDDAKGDITGLGPRAQTYYEETLAWANEHDHAELATELRLMVVDYLRSYKNFLDMALESQGSMDDHLRNSIELAEKEGNKGEAEKYRAELEKVLEERTAETKMIEGRKVSLTKRICTEVAKLSPQGIEEDVLKERVVAIKGSVTCGAQ